MYKYTDEVYFNENSSHGQVFKQIGKNERVLEIGCGVGYLAKAIKEQRNGSVCAIEYDAYALNQAKPYLEKGVVTDADALEWVQEFADKRFNAIVCADVLEHLRDPKAVLKAASDLLEDDGRVIFSVPNIAHSDVIANLINDRFDYTSTGILDDTHIYFFAKENLEDFFQSCGLTLTFLSSTYVPVGDTEQGKKGMNEDVLAFLSSKSNSTAFQFVGVAYKSEYAKKQKLQLIDKTSITLYGKVYFDNGEGFSEDNVKLIPFNKGIFDTTINLPEKLKSIRFDPVEISGYILTDVSFYANNKAITPSSTCSILRLDDSYIVTDSDPHFFFRLNGENSFTIKAICKPILSHIDGAKSLYTIIGDYKRNIMNEMNDKETALSTTAEVLSRQADIILEITHEKDSAKEALYKAKAEIQSLEKNNSLKQEEITQIQSELSECNKKISDMLNEINSIRETKADIEIELSTYKERYLIATEQQEKLHAMIEELSKQAEGVFEIVREKDLAKEALYNAKSELDRVKKELNILSEKLDKANEEYLQTNQTLENVTDELNKANGDIDVLKKNNFSKQEEIARLNSELNVSNEKILAITNEFDALNVAKSDIDAELSTYKEHYCMAIDQRNSLQARVQELEAMYSCISNAACWKITKPLRVTLDVTKKALRKITPLRLFYKFLKCLKQNGIKYTFRKIKDRFRHNKIAKQAMPTNEELIEQKNTVFEGDIKFSILVPLYNTPENLLKEMIESVTSQTYSNWELCLADGSDDEHGYVEDVVNYYKSIDPRVKYSRLENNLGISENTNNCEKMATGDFICLLDHDDLLAPNALFENAKAIEETKADVLYSDEDHLSINGLHVNPFYKPDYSPDLLRSQMYICHFLVINRELFESIGGFDKAFDGSQDYDLMLRLSEKTNKICHIPKILYTWRECEGSTAANADAKPYAHIAGLNALDAHLKRVFGDGAYASESDYTFVFDARYSTMKDEPKVSIIIPMKDKYELTDACVNSILKKSTYQNYEIIILDNRSKEAETFSWFEKIVQLDSRISVHVADMEFNWSKINNYGISIANGEVYIFLNNDIEIISPDWIERLCENALRDDIGVVGPLLLFEDDTIQHAGVIVGFGGWADHVFKGMKPVHYGSPFVSPMVSRNVLAVTGACLAVSKKTIEKIGNFDETFIICGSDIELGIRAYEMGLNNKYLATVRLYHYESKSRDSYIPEQDFKRSYEAYTPYRENIDPYYNINLDINSLIPLESVADMNKHNFKNFLKRCPITAPICKAIKRAIMPPAEYEIPEILAISPRRDTLDNKKLRINLLTPSVDIKHVFGGISTAMKLFESLRKELGCDARMITTDAPVEKSTSVAPQEYEIVSCDDDSNAALQLVSFSSRYNKTIPIREKDVFVATGWWTAYTIKDIIKWQTNEFGNQALPLVYMIQDYEPGFYPWSSRYMMADSTYRLKTPIYAVINSRLLSEFLENNGYHFDRAWDFEPVLNDNLRALLPTDKKTVNKKKQILVYGRPTTERNAFALLMSGIKKWKEKFEEAKEWTVLSAGEAHDDIDLGDGVFVRSCGKLTLDEYANTMLETYAGVSLMVSPHPSYPPLEMSTFGIKTITNTYSNKDLSNFNSNIVSLNSCSADDIGEALTEICSSFEGTGELACDTDYAQGGNPFGNSVTELANELKKLFNN